MDRYRDPIHGFIEVRPLENKIINSEPFQRLRNIKQLAMTYLVYHGAEHTRFGHSLGAMFLVTKAFQSAVSKKPNIFDEKKIKWFEQILRLIALTHDIGHAPFSHASEAVFPDGKEHEDFTELIIKNSCIAGMILEIGQEFVEKYGEDYNITPELICDIYSGKNSGFNSEFAFLKSFMDSELDCDKMDYLLRDSYYCGVNYGTYDVDRLISCLTIDCIKDSSTPRLAIVNGGIQAFEEFVLARYFMFVEVYFHRTRRFFDIMFAKALQESLPGGKYPESLEEYLQWDDCRVMQEIKKKTSESEACNCIINRIVYPRVYNTKTHPLTADKDNFKLVKKQLIKEFGSDIFIEDKSAGKMPHKIPTKIEVNHEKAIVIIDETIGKRSTICDESTIISSLSDKIDIIRLYCKPEKSKEVREFISNLLNE